MNKWLEINQLKLMVGLFLTIILLSLGLIGTGYYYQHKISKLEQKVVQIQLEEQAARIKTMQQLTQELVTVQGKMITVIQHLDHSMDKQYKKYESIRDTLDQLSKQKKEWELALLQLQRSSPTQIRALPKKN